MDYIIDFLISKCKSCEVTCFNIINATLPLLDSDYCGTILYNGFTKVDFIIKVPNGAYYLIDKGYVFSDGSFVLCANDFVDKVIDCEDCNEGNTGCNDCGQVVYSGCGCTEEKPLVCEDKKTLDDGCYEIEYRVWGSSFKDKTFADYKVSFQSSDFIDKKVFVTYGGLDTEVTSECKFNDGYITWAVNNIPIGIYEYIRLEDKNGMVLKMNSLIPFNTRTYKVQDNDTILYSCKKDFLLLDKLEDSLKNKIYELEKNNDICRKDCGDDMDSKHLSIYDIRLQIELMKSGDVDCNCIKDMITILNDKVKSIS